MSADQESSVRAPEPRPLGVIAGSGMLPRALVKKCEAIGLPVAVVALRGFADVADFSPHLRMDVPMGHGKQIVRFFRDNRVQDIVMIGGVRRPSLWEVRPDFWTLSRLGRLVMYGGLGDDGLLRAVRGIFENEGFHIQGIQNYIPDLIAAPGPMGKHAPQEADMPDICRGFEVARALGAVDVGQSVVIQGGIVLGVEAAEGTAELIKRCGLLKRKGPGPVLVKAAKPDQDDTMDLPTIGTETVQAVMAAGFRGIAVQAGATLVLNPVQMVALADPADIFIYGHSG